MEKNPEVITNRENTRNNKSAFAMLVRTLLEFCTSRNLLFTFTTFCKANNVRNAQSQTNSYD